MKKILVLVFLISSFSFGQFFESNEEVDANASSGYFSQSIDTSEDKNQPPPGVDDVPLDDWIFLLPLIGIVIGIYYHLKRRETV